MAQNWYNKDQMKAKLEMQPFVDKNRKKAGLPSKDVWDKPTYTEKIKKEGDITKTPPQKESLTKRILASLQDVTRFATGGTKTWRNLGG
tara:strand:+ start:249 stop:515 length:267 start_codon:yes stop_codon:yes gene_type:complete